jgi:hypothetical protein
MTVRDGWSMTPIGGGWRIRKPDATCFDVRTDEDTDIARFFRDLGPWLSAMLEEGLDRPAERMSDQLRAFIVGMSVSVDVSTGDHDADHRYFGVVSEVMDDEREKNGVMLLVYDGTPNFTTCTCNQKHESRVPARKSARKGTPP